MRKPGRKAAAWHWRVHLALGVAAMVLTISPLAQSQSSSPQERTIGRLNTDVAFSLFLLSNGAFTSLGDFKYSSEDTTAKIDTYNLPLRFGFETSLFGPLELSISGGYGEATTETRGLALQGENPVAGSQAAERQYFSLWNLAFDIGRPVALTPELILTPSVGIGIQHWSGKLTSQASAVAPSQRVTFSTDALLLDAGATLEYRYRWGDLNIRPGAAVSYVDLSPMGGSATYTTSASPTPQRGKASIAAQSTILRAGLSIDGPLGLSLRTVELRWQAFVVGNDSVEDVGLFRWTAEFGAAVGADLGPIGRGTLGVDPGELFVGASYIVGENLSGVRGNSRLPILMVLGACALPYLAARRGGVCPGSPCNAGGLPRDWGCEAGRDTFRPLFPLR